MSRFHIRSKLKKGTLAVVRGLKDVLVEEPTPAQTAKDRLKRDPATRAQPEDDKQ